MADARYGEQESELDWERLSAPVPMDLIDPEFPSHPPEARPGAASEVLPREESEALAREAGVAGASALPAGPGPTPPEGDATHPGPQAAGGPPSADGPAVPGPHALPSGDPSAGTYVDPRATIAGATLFGGADALQDEFTRIRAEMEAEAEAEKRRKLEAEKEEAAQRARLEQWMANARARLLKADADLAGPAGRVRLRKESSPSLYRLAEMQKTMDLSGEPTVPDGTRSLLAPAAPDPMATISVPADQFLGPESPAAPPVAPSPLPAGRQPQAAPPPSGRTPDAGAAPDQAPALSPAADPTLFSPQAPYGAGPSSQVPGYASQDARSSAFFPPRAEDTPYESGPIPLVSPSDEGGPYRPLSREEALTRKVAKLRKAAEAGENTLALAPVPVEDGEGQALNFAIAAVVLIAILVLGLGLFAATQAGLFDGLENRIPFLKPKIAATLPRAIPAKPGPGPAAPGSGPSPSAAPAPAPVAHAAGSAGPAAGAPNPAASDRPAAGTHNLAATPGSRPARAVPSGTPAPAIAATPASPAPAPGKAAAPRATHPSTAGKARKPAAQAAPADPDGEIPAYARPPAKAGNLGEIILRNSIEAALNLDKDNLRELYNRYALGFPGLSGEVVIGLTVDPGGRILEGSVVSSTTGVEAFDQELLRKVLDWRLRSFPESRPKFISVPFLFPMQGH